MRHEQYVGTVLECCLTPSRLWIVQRTLATRTGWRGRERGWRAGRRGSLRVPSKAARLQEGATCRRFWRALGAPGHPPRHFPTRLRAPAQRTTRSNDGGRGLHGGTGRAREPGMCLARRPCNASTIPVRRNRRLHPRLGWWGSPGSGIAAGASWRIARGGQSRQATLQVHRRLHEEICRLILGVGDQQLPFSRAAGRCRADRVHRGTTALFCFTSDTTSIVEHSFLPSSVPRRARGGP
jgi:hypothetical protein